jgi:hypothetical protein
MMFSDTLLNGETKDSNIEDPGPRMQELGTSEMAPFNADWVWTALTTNYAASIGYSRQH